MGHERPSCPGPVVVSSRSDSGPSPNEIASRLGTRSCHSAWPVLFHKHRGHCIALASSTLLQPCVRQFVPVRCEAEEYGAIAVIAPYSFVMQLGAYGSISTKVS